MSIRDGGSTDSPLIGRYCGNVLPTGHLSRGNLPKNLPKIFYLKGIAPYLPVLKDCGATVLSLDWRISLPEASKLIPANNIVKCLQGNLDPLLLTSDPKVVQDRTICLIEEGLNLPFAHIVNLGHGITPDANLVSVQAFVNSVKNYNSCQSTKNL